MEVDLAVYHDVVDGGGVGVAVVPLDGEGAVVPLLEDLHGLGVGELAAGFVHLMFHSRVLLFDSMILYLTRRPENYLLQLHQKKK